jgi:hypothetical protein
LGVHLQQCQHCLDHDIVNDCAKAYRQKLQGEVLW